MNLINTIFQLYNTNMRNKPDESQTKGNRNTKATKTAEMSRLAKELMGQIQKNRVQQKMISC